MKLLNNLKLVLGGVAVASLAACGGGGGSTAETGTLRLALTDAPACGYDAVNVTILKVRVHQSSTANESDGGWSEIELKEPLHVDLLKLQNGDLAELGEVILPTGSYNQMRLVLAENSGSGPLANSVVLTSDNSVVPLTTPSGSQSGVKAKQFNIVIGPNQLANFVIDFDACKSVVVAGNSGKYLLKPQLTVIPRYISGVKGFVDTGIVASGYTNVSLQKDGVVVKATTPDKDKEGLFLLPVAPGSYTLVMTAPGRTTAVVTGVTVAAETVTSINASATPLSPKPLDFLPGTLNGTAPVDTLVRVLQPLALTLTGGIATTVEVAGQFVNGITGSYNYTNLPVDAPLIAPYVAGAPLAFKPDATAAGKYTLSASLNGAIQTVTPSPATLAPGATITTPITFP
jgi:hypothetical protein